MRLPPYQERPGEDLLAKCERIRREIQAAARGAGANDNQPDPDEGGCFWWNREDA